MQQNTLLKGVVFGLIFGSVDATLMLPLEFDNKMVAIAGAFLQRFAIGFLIPHVSLKLPGWLRGLLVSILISLPSAIITSSYAPILIGGAIGGIIIGWFDSRGDK